MGVLESHHLGLIHEHSEGFVHLKIMSQKEFLYVEKYRPQTIEDTILPKGVKKSFSEFVSNQEIPNLLLCGTAGTGKTTTLMKIIRKSLNKGVQPHEIAFVSFSNAATNEGKNRLLEEFPQYDSNDFINFRTLHSLSVSLGCRRGKKFMDRKYMIDFDEFMKVDLRVAKIIDAENVEEADKLIKIIVDLGNEKRTIFAGIKGFYEAESLIGRNIVVVANLEPRKMRFGVSEGMLLAAGDDQNGVFLVAPDTGASPGMRVR